MCNSTKVSKNRKIRKPENRVSLDTLVQLSTADDLGREKLIKRQKAKAITLGQLFPLIDLDSDMKKSYWRAYHCNRQILQCGYKMVSKYCNARWCTVCNRIRMAKMINGYSPALLNLVDLQFITLTRPNVKAHDLAEEYQIFIKSWRAIYKNLRKTYGVIPEGIRKVECTYNPITDSYNLHFHVLMEGRDNGNLLIDLWLKRNPTANRKGQDIRPARDGSLIELFKYAVKGVHKGKFYPKALDNIYRVLKGRRTYQPFGIKKYVDEDVSGIKSQEIRFKGYRTDFWTWDEDKRDWMNSKGELLTEYIIEGKLSDWIESLTDVDEAEGGQEPQLLIEFEEIKEVKSDSYNMSMYSG